MGEREAAAQQLACVCARARACAHESLRPSSSRTHLDEHLEVEPEAPRRRGVATLPLAVEKKALQCFGVFVKPHQPCPRLLHKMVRVMVWENVQVWGPEEEVRGLKCPAEVADALDPEALEDG